MSKGILLIAIGHEDYKKMAYNLAASIKVNDKELPVALATDAVIPECFASLFNKVINVPEKYYTISGKKDYLKSKLFAYDLSPWDETIFLDVDQILVPGKKISPVFDELKEVDITFSNTGPSDVSVWADVAEVKKVYGDKPFWNFHSEFFYFKKNDRVKKYFKEAKLIYERSGLKSAFSFAGGRMADELAFQIAAMVIGLYPHKNNWMPNFWHVRFPKLRHLYPYQLTEYLTYSIGGANMPPSVKTNYNTLAAHYFYQLKLQNPYKAKDKRAFLPSRNQTIKYVTGY